MENIKFAELEDILEDISNIFDIAYEYIDDEEMKKLINTTEDRLHKFLRKAGFIENNKEC